MQYPGGVGEEQAVKVVQDHEGGARDRLASDLRSANGDVRAGRGLLGSRDSGGAIFGNSNETSYGGPDGTRRGATLEVTRQGRGSGAIRAPGRHDDDDDENGASRTRRARRSTRGRESRNLKRPPVSPGGVTAKAWGIPRPGRSRRRPTSLKLHRSCSRAPRATGDGRTVGKAPLRWWSIQANLSRRVRPRERACVVPGPRSGRSDPRWTDRRGQPRLDGRHPGIPG